MPPSNSIPKNFGKLVGMLSSILILELASRKATLNELKFNSSILILVSFFVPLRFLPSEVNLCASDDIILAML